MYRAVAQRPTSADGTDKILRRGQHYAVAIRQTKPCAEGATLNNLLYDRPNLTLGQPYAVVIRQVGKGTDTRNGMMSCLRLFGDRT